MGQAGPQAMVALRASCFQESEARVYLWGCSGLVHPFSAKPLSWSLCEVCALGCFSLGTETSGESHLHLGDTKHQHPSEPVSLCGATQLIQLQVKMGVPWQTWEQLQDPLSSTTSSPPSSLSLLPPLPSFPLFLLAPRPRWERRRGLCGCHRGCSDRQQERAVAPRSLRLRGRVLGMLSPSPGHAQLPHPLLNVAPG